MNNSERVCERAYLDPHWPGFVTVLFVSKHRPGYKHTKWMPTVDFFQINSSLKGKITDDENIQDDQGTPGNANIIASTVAITVSNTVLGDRVSVFRTIDGDTSGRINTTYLTSHATANTVGLTTFQVDSGTPIPTDTASSGVLHVVDQPGQSDHRCRYASWTALTFTLITSGIPTGTVDTVASNSAIGFREDNTDLANILPGDMIRNSTDVSWAHVISVTLVSGTTYDVVHTPLRGGTNNFWTVGDAYRFNQLVVGYNNTDTAYVPYIDKTATGSSTSTSVQFASTRNISARVRKKGKYSALYRQCCRAH